MSAMNPPVRSPRNHPDFAGLLREHQPFAEGTSNGPAESLNREFDLLMLQSGIRCAPTVWLALSLVSALTVGGMAFVLSEQAVATTAAAVVGLLLPVALAILLRSRRKLRVLQQLPGMMEELGRAFAMPGATQTRPESCHRGSRRRSRCRRFRNPAGNQPLRESLRHRQWRCVLPHGIRSQERQNLSERVSGKAADGRIDHCFPDCMG